MKKQTLSFAKGLQLTFGAWFISFGAFAATQNVVVKGSVDNSSSGSGKATMNVGSTVGKSIGNNTQTVLVSGALVNQASGSGVANMNIGSVVNDGGSHSQSVSVGGSIVNSASGGKSEVNIGSVVKD